MSGYVMALDEGTTSCRAILFDRSGAPAAVSQREFAQYYPQPGWVEHDADEIWRAQLLTMREVMQKAGVSCEDIAAVGITNQRETTVVWEKATGRPVCPAIVWQCRRTAAICDELVMQGLAEIISEKTGLIPDAYFSATKLKWILENVPGARAKAENGELLFGTIDSFLIWRLTGGKVHVTDYSNASRTMLFNIHTLEWDKDLTRLFGIPECMLPEVRPSSCVYGMTEPSLLGGSIAIGGAAGDQQSALFGHGCFEPGSAKNTYGTGCFTLMNTGTQPVLSENGLITTIAWGVGGEVTYALEGSIFVAGAALQWLRDELGLIGTAAESEAIAKSVADTAGVYFVPAFVGLGAPYWDPYARGTITGITRGANKAHIVRAALESLAYQTDDILKAMERDSGVKLCALDVDGGAAANDFLMQFQADITGVKVERPGSLETTALGAAYLAGIAVGFWSGMRDVVENTQKPQLFAPQIERDCRAALLLGWHEAVRRSRGEA